MQIVNPSTVAAKNWIANSANAFYQTNASDSLIGNGSTFWTNFDMNFVANALGTSGVVTTHRISTGEAGYAPNLQRVSISTAPTAAQANGLKYYDFIGNDATFATSQPHSLTLLKAPLLVTYSIRIRAFGNVTGITITPVVSTVAANKPVTAVSGATALNFTVNSGGFTECTGVYDLSSILGTASYHLGFQVTINTVSSGNTYDLGNGIDISRRQMNLGSTLQDWVPFNGSYLTDLNEAKRWYQLSYVPGIFAGASARGSMLIGDVGLAAAAQKAVLLKHFEIAMWATPSMSYYDSPGNANVMSWWDNTNVQTDNAAFTQNVSDINVRGFKIVYVAPTNAAYCGVNWIANCQLAT